MARAIIRYSLNGTPETQTTRNQIDVWWKGLLAIGHVRKLGTSSWELNTALPAAGVVIAGILKIIGEAQDGTLDHLSIDIDNGTPES